MENEVKDFDLNLLGYEKTTALFEELIKNGDEFCCDKLEDTGNMFSMFRANISRDCEPRVQDFYNAGIKDTKVIAYFYATLTHYDDYTVFSKKLGKNIELLEDYSPKEHEKFKVMKKLYYRDAYKQMFLRQEKLKEEYKEENGF